MKRIYISGPYSSDPEAGTAAAIAAGDRLLKAGFAPFVPHLCHFWEQVYSNSWETWLAWDLAWLPVCRAVLRLPGESRGADVEVAEAARLGIPVFGSVEEVLAHTWNESPRDSALLRQIREWCEASNEYGRAGGSFDDLTEAEHAAHALLPEILSDENGNVPSGAFKDHGPHNPNWLKWAEVRDALSAAKDRVKAAVDRYNAAHAELFRLSGVAAFDDECR